MIAVHVIRLRSLIPSKISRAASKHPCFAYMLSIDVPNTVSDRISSSLIDACMRFPAADASSSAEEAQASTMQA
jgi:hypothetical protein